MAKRPRKVAKYIRDAEPRPNRIDADLRSKLPITRGVRRLTTKTCILRASIADANKFGRPRNKSGGTKLRKARFSHRRSAVRVAAVNFVTCTKARLANRRKTGSWQNGRRKKLNEMSNGFDRPVDRLCLRGEKRYQEPNNDLLTL